MNSISIRFCPVLFIHLFTPIEGPMIHQNIQRGICGLDLVNVILRGPRCKFSALGPEFLATALVTTAFFINGKLGKLQAIKYHSPFCIMNKMNVPNRCVIQLQTL